MRATEFLTEETTLNQIYQGGLPDRDELIWEYIGNQDLDKPLEVQMMPTHKLMIQLLSQYHAEHIDELTSQLKGSRKQIIKDYMKDPGLSDNIIVICDGRIVDGNHRALAAALKGVPIHYVDLNDLDQEIDETINRDILNPAFKHQQEIGDFILKAEKKSGKLAITCFHEGSVVGSADFNINEKNLTSDLTWVSKQHRSMGVASTMYAYAKMLGNDVVPSGQQLPPGKAMWDAWRKSGEDKHLVAEAINPGTTRKHFTHTQEIGDFTYTAVGQEIGDLDITAFHNGKKIGHAIFNIYGRGIEKRLESGATFVKPAYEKKGVAATMYAYAKMLGNDIKPSPTQTPDGKAMWNSWFDKGDARHLLRDDSYQPPELHTGDKILKGKFKNSPAEIKGFKKDKHNQPVLKTNKGDIQLFKPRVTKLMKEGAPFRVSLDKLVPTRDAYDWNQMDPDVVGSFAGIVGTPKWDDNEGTLVVEPRPDGRYDIIDGHHRYAGLKKAGAKDALVTLDEDWKHAAAAGAIALGALNPFNNPAPNQLPNAPIVSPVARTPHLAEKILITVAKASGIVGVELAQLLAQCSHETANYSTMQEKGSPTYFARKYDPRFAPKKAKLLGNKKAGDGVKYHGRGFIQLTGRYNYGAAEKALGIPLLAKPELAADPQIAAKIAIWYWNSRVKPHAGDFSDTGKVTHKINAPQRGLANRQAKFADYKGF